MIGESRPLRFVMAIVGGWIGVRVAILWPAEEPVAALVAAAAPQLIGAPAADAGPFAPAAAAIDRGEPIARAGWTRPALAPASRQGEPLLTLALTAPAPVEAIADSARLNAPQPGEAIGAPLPPPDRGAGSRLSASAWLIARGAGAAAQFSPQLGGSQAGARLTYALGDSRRLSVAARISSALAVRQREAAIGLDWRPTALPIHLFAEQRIALAGSRGGPAAGVIAGLPPKPIAAGFALEGYGQAGVIARDGGEAFVDGAAHLRRRVAKIGTARVELGLGAWGGAQRGASRFDVGPAASIAIPAALPLRVSLEWRQRVAGDARPESGPALSIGADF
ncbi:hypothetical protein ACM61V_01920 [Sphingomonas sp. TX0543]|uniref:hypothetical protein n=1 Tax=unclassified Sphingomonas TaxID=196159 RepID=UPI0020168D41|nr:hypothetical protein [Sphingomonas sp. 3P27F8]